MSRPDAPTRRICAWCMHTITDQCAPFTTVFAGHPMHYCDNGPGHNCYTDHLNGVSQRLARRDDRGRR